MTTDKALALKATHDPEAFGELYDRYALRIYRYIYSRVRHRENAEDITSQVFHDALKCIDQYQPIAPFSAWLFTIARRRIADFYRSSIPTVTLTEEVPQDSQAMLTKVMQEDDRQDLERQLLVLDDKARELLRLRFAGRMRYKDIAILVNKTTNAVKMAIYRILDQLKENVENHNG